MAELPQASFFSGAWGTAYEVNSDSAADAGLAAVLDTIDFPRAIETAFSADGVRTFLEIGPGSSCCRIIDGILKDREHISLPIHLRHQDPLSTLLNLLSELHVLGVDLDLAPLYGDDRREQVTSAKSTQSIRVPAHPEQPRFEFSNAVMPQADIGIAPTAFVEAAGAMTATAEAHEVFLRFSTQTQERMAETIAVQTRILEQWVRQSPTLPGDRRPLPESTRPMPNDVPRSLEFAQCLEFAAGRVGEVLGPLYAEVDGFPTRVRLPDGPLMLVDRILQIEGEPHSLTFGRVVTEHRVHGGRWYLDSGSCPTCVAVEAGQADLFLSGFLGIDFQTRGLAVYRLLDAAITFHRALPRIGETIRYDIHIDRFFRQGDTHLFQFRFEATVDGEPLLSMSDGCAGFFTAEELAGGKGIVQTELDRRQIPGKRPADWQALARMRKESLSSVQIDALRAGDLAAAFGESFAGLPLRSPMRLPDGMLRLIDRVPLLDPEGGRFGLGLIRAEADIHPDDWFLTCHFVDDMVMPGTLMYECCLHTLRVFLMRLGWIGEEGQVNCEPVPGIAGKLKCRGQVIASTKVAAYEVSIKEIGYGPEPFAITDALMYADGKPVVEIVNMSLRMAGLDRTTLESMWQKGSCREVVIPLREMTASSGLPSTMSRTNDARARRPAERDDYTARREVLFDTDRILAFATGKPSDAFGEPYRVFDAARIIARLPGPPYQFLDRITGIDAEAWKMTAGGVIEAEYDVPRDAWYFAAQRAASMPFSVLLEVALQPCGWLAAYIGSALTSEVDLSFRNLGGSAIQHRPVGPDIGTLTTTVKISRASTSGGMIIQHYDYAVRAGGQDIYTGDTYFGFFSKQALANQVGLRELSLYVPSTEERHLAESGTYPREFPFPEPMLRMVDKIAWFLPNGGPHGFGAVEGRIAVDPGAWFFKAHFHQDPVWPGSLGLESFLQLLRFVAWKRWGIAALGLRSSKRDANAGELRKHQWTYRGQVLPTDREVTVQAIITHIDNVCQTLTADGLLSVDGRIIYTMTGFTVEV